ncbi:MAG: serine/threonine-protein kinase, partial [Pyrinomonadaceae bacterium]
MRECPKCGTCYGEDTLTCQFHDAETKQIIPGSQCLAGRYFIEKRLGRGAMGQVYLARDENLGTRHVAVKTVRPDLLTNEDLQEGEAIARFEREARSAASIRHPNVVDVTDFGKSAEGVFFLVMEYVEGDTLHDLLRREGTLAATRALNLLKQMAAGVEAAHEAGILHRDLKPANIFLLRTGKKINDGFIKVGDFGLAKMVGDAAAEISAKQGPASRGIIGTPEFMAPEQMHSELPIDGRADIYALGTIAYMMLGGRVPFTGDLMQIISSKMTQQPPPLSKLRSDIAPEIERAIMHALETVPDNRPATVSDWIEELSAAVEKAAKIPENPTNIGRLVILAPVGAEVYVDDERRG